jgi:hypothetical protein
MIWLTRQLGHGVQSFGKHGGRIISKFKPPLVDRQTDRFQSPNTGIAKGEPPYTPTLPAAQETAFREAVSLSRNVTTGREGKLFSISETSDMAAYPIAAPSLHALSLSTTVVTIFTTSFHVLYLSICPSLRVYVFR